MSQPELARQSGSSLSSVVRIEAGGGTHHEATRDRLVDTLEKAGIRFLSASADEGPGVRWTSPEVADKAIQESIKGRTKASPSK